ncbi:MAG: alpha/beta hydrolase [Proteobacteria bacterium]|nr:alpha/beta hydrolase [Pseudomonadota bacterium]
MGLNPPDERFRFLSPAGHELAAVLDRPAGTPRGYALFAHCFTCGKDFIAARRICDTLAAHGWGVLRFDFAGVGDSGGELSGFAANVDDLRAAADALRARGQAPTLLIGHSLGGAAVLAAAEAAPEVRVVVTVGAPADPAHVLRNFTGALDEIERRGSCEVTLAGRPFRITREFVEATAGHQLLDHVRRLNRALFVFHAPEDEVVSADNAAAIFTAARHPKSFISLAGADHLLTRPADAAYVGKVIAAVVERYLSPPAAHTGGA